MVLALAVLGRAQQPNVQTVHLLRRSPQRITSTRLNDLLSDTEHPSAELPTSVPELKYSI